MTNLAVNMITYNGLGAFVKEALEAVKPIVDEIVVYDTGSTDGTYEYLKSLKDIKLFYEDVGKFGERDLGAITPVSNRIIELLNEAKKNTKSEWIIKVDDDEIFTHELLREIKTMKKDYPIYSIPFYHVGTGSKQFLIKRLFQNIPQVWFTGAFFKQDSGVGETLTLNGRKLSSKRCPRTKNFFYHLGSFKKNVNERNHDYSKWL
jgi:glycosyltransferase involved in cell wall biosynthesis